MHVYVQFTPRASAYVPCVSTNEWVPSGLDCFRDTLCAPSLTCGPTVVYSPDLWDKTLHLHRTFSFLNIAPVFPGQYPSPDISLLSTVDLNFHMLQKQCFDSSHSPPLLTKQVGLEHIVICSYFICSSGIALTFSIYLQSVHTCPTICSP